MEVVVPALGLLVLLGIAWALSDARRAIDWRIPAWGIVLQVVFGVLVLKTDAGRAAFRAAGEGVVALLDFTYQGSAFVFGERLVEPGAAGSLGFVFAFRVLPTILFFSALMSVLYHLRILGAAVRGIGRLLQGVMRVSGAEAFSGAANIFVGQTEAPFVVRPYLSRMTRSEVFCVMTGGFATVAGGVLASYIGMAQSSADPEVRARAAEFAAHLIGASVMSAPAALAVAKVMRPETGEPLTRGRQPVVIERPGRNVLDAAVIGAREGLVLAANVAAMLIVFIALIALVNAGIAGIGRAVAGDASWSLEAGLGFLLAPLAWLMGTPWGEARAVGELVGVKTVLNEFIAYQRLTETGGALSPRAFVVATYALCGFSNFASIGIQVGGIGAMVPELRPTLAREGLPAMVAGSLACFMTAAVAAMLL